MPTLAMVTMTARTRFKNEPRAMDMVIMVDMVMVVAMDTKLSAALWWWTP